jgi:hypothetical protein
MGFLTRPKLVRQVTLFVVSVLTVSTLFRQNVPVEPTTLPQNIDTLINVSPVVFQRQVNETKIRSTCFTSECFQKQGGLLARAFPDRPKDSWCIPATRPEENTFRDGKWQGLLLVKVPKAASSTAAGLTLRIANQTGCAVQFEHREGIEYAERHAESFLLGTVRRPAARAFSMAYFFIIAPLNITPTDKNIIRSLNRRRGGKTQGKGGYMFNYMSLKPIPGRFWKPAEPTHVLNETVVIDYVQDIFNSYDFITVVERMDESLTALALVTGLDLGDVLTTSAKVSGDYKLARSGKNEGQCSKSIKGKMSKGVKQYFETKAWLAMNYADYILYEAANRSLDLTIERIGRDRFDRALADFRRIEAKAMQVCGDHLGSGCTGDGLALPETTCYVRDFGCGHKCVDAMLRDEKISA